MKRMKQQTVLVYSVDKVICNCCGKSIDIDSDIPTDYLNIKKRWGYGSSLDSKEYEMDICEDCFKKIISDFKYPPKNENNEIL